MIDSARDPGFTRRGALGLATLSAWGGAATSSAAAVSRSTRSPLASPDQRRLDRLALEVWRTQDLRSAKAIARTAFLAAYLGVPSREALSRLDHAIDELAFGMVQTAANNDPFRPGVYWLGAQRHHWFGRTIPGSRWAFDNPDTVYRTVPIDPASSYVIRGRRLGSGTADLAFSLVNNLTTQTTVDYVDGQRLRSRRNPSYVVTVGPDPADGRPNHLQTTDDTVQLFIRSTIADWGGHRPDRLTVRRRGGGPIPPPRTVRDVGREARQLLIQGAPIFAALLARTRAQPVNTIAQPGTTPGALVTQANTFAHFRLDDDEALVVTMTPGGARYLTLPVTDPWMVGVAPGRFQSSLNDRQAAPDRDGRYRFVVSRLDPGVPNWVSTADRREGTIMARWQRIAAQADPGPAISTEVVPLSRVRSALPRATPSVSKERRRRDLRERQRAYRSRFDTG